jgi:hypothetical protein
MLEHLKVIDGHASRNVLKRCQNMINGVPIFHSKTPILTSISLKPKGSKPNLFAFIDFRPFASDGEWMMTKVTMLYSQSKNMATIACCFAPPNPKMFYL